MSSEAIYSQGKITHETKEKKVIKKEEKDKQEGRKRQ
jgi:hypothetical protein